MFPDANASFRNRKDVPIRQVNYGQLLDIFYLKLNEHGDPKVGNDFLLARVLPCKITSGEDATSQVVEYRSMEAQPLIINLVTIGAAVGRVKRHETWCIIDRSKGAVHTLFMDNDNTPNQDSICEFVPSVDASPNNICIVLLA